MSGSQSPSGSVFPTVDAYVVGCGTERCRTLDLGPFSAIERLHGTDSLPCRLLRDRGFLPINRKNSRMLTREHQTLIDHPSSDGSDPQPAIEGQRGKRFRFPHPAIILGYSVSVIMGGVGLLILGGILFSQGVPDKFRIMFGIVVTLMGVYRFVLTRSRSLQRQRDEREEA